MLKLIAATLLGMAAIGLLVSSGPDHRNEAAVPAPAPVIAVTTLEKEAPGFLRKSHSTGRAHDVAARTGVSDDEAIRIAIENGAALRAARGAQPKVLRAPAISQPGPEPVQVTAAVAGAVEMAPQPEVTRAAPFDEVDLWRVTGTQVNLRAGPGTGHEVVGQAELDDKLVPLSDTDAAWIQVRLPDGKTAWIFGKFLARDGA